MHLSEEIGEEYRIVVLLLSIDGGWNGPFSR
jgi:hypothetical protein